MKSLDLIKELINVESVSGHEEKIRSKITDIISPYVDETRVDAMGNLIAVKKSSLSGVPKFMLAAHMDEVGFIVTSVEEDGIIRAAKLGGVKMGSAAFSEVTFENGKKGVFLPELDAKFEELDNTNTYIDIGARDKKEAEKYIKPGMRARLTPVFTRLLHKKISLRGLDDKAGCALLIETIMDLAGEKCLPFDLYFVFTVQEEVGLRGAKSAAFGISPDYALAVDVTGSMCPGRKGVSTYLGKGAAIKIKDRGIISSPIITEHLKKVAEKQKIKVQFEVHSCGGTDADVIQSAGAGVATGGISIPITFTHSTSEIIDLSDYEECKKLIKGAVSCRI